MEAGAQSDSICARIFRYVYGQKKDEQLRFAVQKLIKTVMFEAIVNNFPARFMSPLSNPISAPNSTPQEIVTKNYYIYRDLTILYERRFLQDGEQQFYIHREMCETEAFNKIKKFAKKWMDKTKISSRNIIPQNSSLSGYYTRPGVVAAASEFMNKMSANSYSYGEVKADEVKLFALPEVYGEDFDSTDLENSARSATTFRSSLQSYAPVSVRSGRLSLRQSFPRENLACSELTTYADKVFDAQAIQKPDSSIIQIEYDDDCPTKKEVKFMEISSRKP